MNKLPIKREDAVAFFRFQIISEMLDAEPGFVEATAKRLSKQQFNDVVNKRMISYSERTIFRYYSDYKKHGFDGLKPKVRKDKGSHPGIDTRIISDILALKKELPSRSAAKNSAGGRCHDNAKCESLWGRFKEELLYDRYDTKKMPMTVVKSLIWRYFMSYWNNRRICSANGGLPPMVKRKKFYEGQYSKTA